MDAENVLLEQKKVIDFIPRNPLIYPDMTRCCMSEFTMDRLRENLEGGVVPLHSQIAGKFLGVLGDLYDAGVPEGSGGFLVRLPFLPPFGVRCGFVADDLA